MTMTLALFSKQRGFGGLESLPAAQNRARIPFPSLRCASAIQIVRLLQSIPETQLQLQPGSRGLSAMISNTSGVYDSKGAGQSFSVRTSTGMTRQSARISKIAKCACLDQGIFHQRLVNRRDAKGDQVVGKQRSLHGFDSGELLRSLSRKFKNVGVRTATVVKWLRSTKRLNGRDTISK